MMIIACVDDNNGLLFNKRRQSRDKAVINDIMSLTDNENNLYINDFSSDLFENNTVHIISDANQIPDNAYFFVENISVLKLYDKLTKLILYKWNRIYPFDFKMDIDLSKMRLISSTDIIGSSHIITKEEYVK